MTTSAYRVLARKYRPSRFADLIGQEALVRTLTNALASRRLAHAYLFTGVRGIGKTTTARILARALNCVDGPTAEPCGTCEHCRAILEDRHVDVIEMDAASRTGVGDVREIIEAVRYAPAMARYKVYIIDEVHMLSVAAFNALLKTLEEPPPHVVFIFATTETRKVPVTVVSRCQRFDLRRVDTETLTAHLARVLGSEDGAAEDQALALIARVADGSVRDALSLLDQAMTHCEGPVTAAAVEAMLGLADRTRVFDLFEAAMRGDIAAALSELRRAYDAGVDPTAVVQDLLAVTHWVTRLKLVPEAANAPGVPEAERRRGGACAEGLSIAVLSRTWQMLLKGLDEARTAPNTLAAVEMLLARLAYVAELPSPAELVARLTAGSTTAVAPAGAPAEAAAAPPAAAEPPPPGAAEPPSSDAPRAALAVAEPLAEAPADPRSFDDVVALAERKREPVLVAQLRHNVRPVRFEPGRIEFALTGDVPPDFAHRLGRSLGAWTGRRWVAVVVGDEAGGETLAEREAAARRRTIAAIAEHPEVKAVLEAFPGAEIVAVDDGHPPPEREDTP